MSSDEPIEGEPVDPYEPPRSESSGPRSTLAATGMTLGIVSVTFGLCCCYGVPFNVSGIAVSILALRQIAKSPDLYTGRGMAVAGLVTSCASLGLGVLFAAVGLAANWAEIIGR